MKWQFLLTFISENMQNNKYAYVRGRGEGQKDQKYAYVIHQWSLSDVSGNSVEEWSEAGTCHFNLLSE